MDSDELFLTVLDYVSAGAASVAPPTLNLKVGTYVGDGTNPHAITGLGFTPKMVMIYADAFAGAVDRAGCVWKSTSLPAGGARHWGENGTFANVWTSLDADGFTLTDSVFANNSGTTFYYVAFGGVDVVVGTFTGDGGATKGITGVGFKPTWVFVADNSLDFTMHHMTSTGDASDVTHYGSDVADTSNVILSLDADGFTVGNRVTAGSSMNVNAVIYYYVAIKPGSRVYNVLYAGDGNDNRAVTGFGFQPDFVFIKTTANIQAAVKSSSLAGDSTGGTRTNVSFAADMIQSLDADGITLGTSTRVNGVGKNYHLIAFKS